MLNLLISNLESAILQTLREAGVDDFISLTPHAKFLSDSFTRGRGSLPPDYFADPHLRAAYLAHFVLTNACKVMHCLSQVFEPCMKDKLRILDIGSGPGTAALGVSEYFAARYPGTQVEIIGIEQNARVARDGEALFERLGHPRHVFRAKVAKINPDLIAQTGKKFDIVIASNIINEIKSLDTQFSIVRAILDSLAPGGASIIIDPALRETTRPLMQLHDRILSEKIAQVAAPCLHCEPCPMLAANERDWCHFYIEWKRPELIRKMDEIAGTNHEHLKMAYLVLKPQAETGKEKRPLWRAVSSPLVSKGKIELVLCGSGGGLKKIMRQDKNRSSANSDLDKVKRGDIVACIAEKIKKEDSFEIWTEWNRN